MIKQRRTYPCGHIEEKDNHFVRGSKYKQRRPVKIEFWEKPDNQDIRAATYSVDPEMGIVIADDVLQHMAFGARQQIKEDYVDSL